VKGKMDFNPIINARMLEEGISITDLAHKSGISIQHISALLKGRRRWNETTLGQVCGALGLEIALTLKETGSDAVNQ